MILCCGEALIDMIPAQIDADRQGYVPHSGGAIFNTAIALGRLGAPTGFLSGLSTDLFGEQLVQTLRDSHVDTGTAVRSDLPTTLAFVRLSDGQASYTFYDENTAGRSLSPDNLPDISDKVSTLYFGGISLISEPCADFYAALALRETQSRVIMMDPNIRTSFIADEQRYRARLDQMMAHCDILKASDEDLEWILPGPASLAQKADMMCAKGPKIVIVTRGGEGATAYLADGRHVDVPAQRVEVKDTVGAGDTFNAGVLASLHAQECLKKGAINQIDPENMQKALAHGAKVAAITVSRHGANPPWAHEL